MGKRNFLEQRSKIRGPEFEQEGYSFSNRRRGTRASKEILRGGSKADGRENKRSAKAIGYEVPSITGSRRKTLREDGRDIETRGKKNKEGDSRERLPQRKLKPLKKEAWGENHSSVGKAATT